MRCACAAVCFFLFVRSPVCVAVCAACAFRVRCVCVACALRLLRPLYEVRCVAACLSVFGVQRCCMIFFCVRVLFMCFL